MPDVDEKSVFDALLKYRLHETISAAGTEVEIQFRPVDNRVADSPDFLLWVDISFELFGQPVKISVPVPVEAEKGGIYGGALEDLRKLVERRRHLVEIPMIVVSEAGYASKEQVEMLATRFSITQVPVRRLNGSAAEEY